jgi:hypothetical protein
MPMDREVYTERCKNCNAKHKVTVTYAPHDEGGTENFDLRCEKCGGPLVRLSAFGAIAKRVRKKT